MPEALLIAVGLPFLAYILCIGVIVGGLSLSTWLYKRKIRSIFRPILTELAEMKKELLTLEQELKRGA